jgi:DNA adenine methylase
MRPPTDLAVAPLLRWAGSKRKLLPRLLPLWEQAEHGRYIEPFVGSAAMFFAARPARAVLSDMNSELIRTYRTIRREPANVGATLARLPKDKQIYLRLRAQRPHDLPAVARAARFVYLNRNCFNGLYRTNLNGEFNVPYAAAKTGSAPGTRQLRAIASRLKSATLLSGDFERIVTKVVRAHDFVYLDPPYAVANRRIFRQYSATTFGFADLHRLSALLYSIDAVGAKFVLSYALCPEALAAFQQWPNIRVMTQRNIAGFSAHRRRSSELIVTNIA